VSQETNELRPRFLSRRSQRYRLTWDRLTPLADLCIPNPKILHPHPNVRFHVKCPK
jgi:hypothetical protein